jgi:hypothetical protein
LRVFATCFIRQHSGRATRLVPVDAEDIVMPVLERGAVAIYLGPTQRLGIGGVGEENVQMDCSAFTMPAARWYIHREACGPDRVVGVDGSGGPLRLVQQMYDER